jgi:hypothetical protein
VNSLAIGNTSTANAVYATTLGPYSVSNAEFGVACGYSTYVNGIGAHANGCDSNAYGPGMIAEASGRNNVHGDGQGTTQYLVNTTSDATPTALLGVLGKSLKYLDYQGNADFSKTMLVNITVVARRTDTPGTDSVWTAQGVLRGNGSSAYTWIGGSPPTFSVVAQDAGASTWALAVSVSSNTLTLNATGQVGKTIDWTAKILAVETV